MAGLLDFLSSPDAQFGLGLLGAAAPRAGGVNFGQGLQEALGYVDKQRQMKAAEMAQAQAMKLQDTQMRNYDSEIEARKLAAVKDARMQGMIEQMMGGGAQPGLTQGGGGPGMSASGVSSSQGQPGPSGFTSIGQGGGGIIGVSKQLGLPPEAIQADMVFNGGKKISEMLASRSEPKWQNINGNLVNTNAPGFTGGMQGGMNASANGQVTAWQPDGRGGLVVGAPAGAIDTARAYADIGERSKAQYDPFTYTPKDEANPRLTTRLNAVGVGQPASPGYANEGEMRATVAGDMGADPAAIQREIAATQADLKKTLDQPSKLALQSHLNALMGQEKTIGSQGSGSGGGAQGMQLQSPAEAARLLEQVKADIQPTQQKQAGIDSAQNAYDLVNKALLHPGLSTSTGLSGTLDPRNYIPGTNAKNFGAIQKQLQGNAFLSAYASLKGGGQITEVEGMKAENAIARLQTAQSTDEYKSALKDYQTVIGQGLKRMGVDVGGDTGPKPPQPMKGMIRGGYKFKGGDPADQANWEKQ